MSSFLSKYISRFTAFTQVVIGLPLALDLLGPSVVVLTETWLEMLMFFPRKAKRASSSSRSSLPPGRPSMRHYSTSRPRSLASIDASCPSSAPNHLSWFHSLACKNTTLSPVVSVLSFFGVFVPGLLFTLVFVGVHTRAYPLRIKSDDDQSSTSTFPLRLPALSQQNSTSTSLSSGRSSSGSLPLSLSSAKGLPRCSSSRRSVRRPRPGSTMARGTVAMVGGSESSLRARHATSWRSGR